MNVTMRTAWFCPSCQRYHAPHCDTCPGISYELYKPYVSPSPVPHVPVWTPWQQPSTGDPLRVQTWGGIGIGGVCAGQANNSSGLQ